MFEKMKGLLPALRLPRDAVEQKTFFELRIAQVIQSHRMRQGQPPGCCDRQNIFK
jgi:hypothetical protein